MNPPTLILSHLSGGRYVLKELIETEKHYVTDLGLIVGVKLTILHTLTRTRTRTHINPICSDGAQGT